MPRRATDAPLYRRGDSPYWWTWVYEGGKRVRKSTQCTDRRAALIRAAELQRENADPGSKYGDETVADALVAYIEEIAPHRAPLSMIAYKARALAVAASLGPVRLVDFERDHLQRYVTQRNRGKRTVASEVTVLKAALHLAKRRGRRVMDLDMLDVQVPGDVKPKQRWLTLDESARLIAALPAHRGDWVRVAIYTGARWAEIEAMQWEDVDLVARTIHIRGTKGKRGAKNASDRVVPLAAELVTWMEVQPVRAGKLVKRWIKPELMLEGYCKKLGMERCTAHDFRRTFASWLKQRGVDSAIGARLIGDSTTALFDQVYAQVDLATLRRAIETL